ncbi:MAG: ABC transporter ATP-binding protein, partial [Lachnospiraceae bacterium]|nr:ABC transporter ATP-binding protein [Lachnospiraceae bacterium]
LMDVLFRAGLKPVADSLSGGIDRVLTREFAPEGVVFSGGQNQKLVAARAFLQDTPVRIFDEPSSALDPVAEHELMENIKKDSTGRILLLISHRLSSVQDMKKIIVLKDGRITEQGTHGQLMEAGGEYAALYQMQAERYRMETAFSDPRAVFTKSSMAEQGGVKG